MTEQCPSFVPLQPWIGAEVRDIDLTAPLTPRLVETLKAAWAQYKVLVFRDQDVTREQHKALGRAFGLLDPHPAESVTGDPDIGPIAADPSMPSFGILQEWHTDESWMAVPPRGALLRAFTVPPIGGETGFTNNCRAFEMLDQRTKDRIRPLNAIHVPDFYNYTSDPEKLRELNEANPPREHPLVIVLPETGEECLYINPHFTHGIAGLSEKESRELLFMLFWHMTRLEFQLRVRWQPHSIVLWDERATLHNAVIDFEGSRYLERVVISGEAPPSAQPVDRTAPDRTRPVFGELNDQLGVARAQRDAAVAAC